MFQRLRTGRMWQLWHRPGDTLYRLWRSL